MKKYCPICKELATLEEQKEHESPLGLEGTNLFRRKLQCGCSMTKCHAGIKQFYQCKEHQRKLILGR